jgi:quinol monooxygenase YgiN
MSPQPVSAVSAGWGASTEAYNAHLQAEHFKKYKRTTDPIVKSLKLVRVDPLLLGAKAR